MATLRVFKGFFNNFKDAEKQSKKVCSRQICFKFLIINALSQNGQNSRFFAYFRAKKIFIVNTRVLGDIFVKFFDSIENG